MQPSQSFSLRKSTRANSGHVAAYPACVKNLAQASADNRRTNCPMRRRSASQKPNRQPRLRISAPIGNPDSIPTETALIPTSCVETRAKEQIDPPMEVDFG